MRNLYGFEIARGFCVIVDFYLLKRYGDSCERMDKIEKLTEELELLQIENREAELELTKRIRAATRARDKQGTKQDVPRDRRGQEVTIGARVKLLTTGLFQGSDGVVTKLGKDRATIRLDSKRTTNRIYNNIQVETTARNERNHG